MKIAALIYQKLSTTLLLLALMVFNYSVEGQTVINDDHHDHNQTYISCDYIVSPGSNNSVEISGSSEVFYISKQKINLKPGFSISGLTGNGRFKAKISNSELIVDILEPDSISKEVGIYEKIEFGILLPDTIQMLVDTFLNNPPESIFENYFGLNPFDPDDISIEARFSMVDFPGIPEKKVYGFYFKDYHYMNLSAEQAYWVENPTEHNWRIRFAPDRIGTWQVSVYVSFRSHPEIEPLFYFCEEIQCIESSNPGYLVQNELNTRMLKFSKSNEQFFGLGLNVAWPTKWLGGSGYYYVNDPIRFVEHRNYIRNVALNNGNLTRVITTPFDYNFEWEMLNFYDSKIDIDTVSWGSSPDSYELVGRLALAYEMDSLILMCEDLGMYLILCHEYHFQYASSHANPNGFINYPYTWPNNPYNSIPGIDSVTDFLTKEIAHKYYQNKIRYTLARWGYSSAIMGHEFVNEIDQMNCIGAYDQTANKGWEYCPYYDDSEEGIQFRKDLKTWHLSMIDFIKRPDKLNYNNHLYSTSYGVKPFSTDSIPYSMDFVNWHPYSSDRIRHKTRYNSISTFFHNKPDLFNKPFYIGEMGLSGSTPEGCPTSGFYNCNDLSFHNDLWATSMFSSLSTGMHWWWNKGIIAKQLHTIDPLRIFFENIDISTNNINSVGASWDLAPVFNNNDNVEFYYSGTLNLDLVYGWIHNTDVYWENYLFTFQECLTDPETGWSDDCIPDNPSVIDSVYAEIVFENIIEGVNFTLRRFNTRTGDFYPSETYISSGGKLIIPFGYLGNKAGDIENPSDYGFIITKN